MNGMDDNDEDTFYDDDFPDIADDELQILEQNAITFTQQEQATLNSRKQPLHQSTSLSKTQSIDTPVRYRQPPAEPNVPRNLLQQHRGKAQNTSTDSFDNTILDEDGLPLVMEERSRGPPQRQVDETTAREQWRKDRFAQPNPQMSQRVRQPYRPPGQVNSSQILQPQAYPGVVRRVLQTTKESATTPAIPALYEEEALRHKIEELEASLQQANEEIRTRRGEVSNIRSKQDEASRKHQRELSLIQKGKQEEAEKHKAAFATLVAEKDVIVDKIRLLNHELDEETRRVQMLQRQLKDRPLKDKPANVNTTPKRNANTLRDGFDDEDLMVISPVKSGRRSKPATPTANRKRKLPNGTDVNVQPLVLRPSGSGPETNDEPAIEPPKIAKSPPIVRKDRETERHLRLIQQVLTFRTTGSQEVLMEQLVKLSFPSDPTKTLGSIVLVATAALSGTRLAGDLLQVFIQLWSRALREKYYVCLEMLIEVISYVIDIDLFVIDADIITNILPVIEATIEINAKARFHLLVKKEWLDDAERKKPEINSSLRTASCLELLHTIACLISDEPERIKLFWQSITTDFVLMMLNACQPINDVTIVLQLLATSILPTTFGNVCPPDQQSRMETYITDRICYLLWEQPKTLETEPRYPRAAICHLRLEALNLLARLTMTSSPNPSDPSLALNHGTTFLVGHVTAIARLVRSIYDEVDNMYLVTPTQPLHAKLVNTAVAILYFILNSPAGREVDLQASLARINGGAHKYRVVLTRLTFREGLFVDRGITDETVRMATELLEDGVTPDEAEDLMAAFGGSEGRIGRSTQG